MSENLEQTIKKEIFVKASTMDLYRLCARKVLNEDFEKRRQMFSNCLQKSNLLSQLELQREGLNTQPNSN
jgi:hypothetical protein